MRTSKIIIGGQSYSVKGLSVSQSLDLDLELAEKKRSQSEVRMRRVALCLQNGDAWLPDPASPQDENGKPKGQIRAKEMSLEELAKLLDSGIFEDINEWYAAELEIGRLNGAIKPAPGDKTAGESKADPKES